MPKTVDDLVAEAKARIENLTPDQVAEEMERGAVVVDVREGEELRQHGKIPGSVHVPRGFLEFRADPTSNFHNPALHPSKRIIVHCAGGLRSALAARSLQELGYENVGHLEGGFEAWVSAGHPVERVSP